MEISRSLLKKQNKTEKQPDFNPTQGKKQVWVLFITFLHLSNWPMRTNPHHPSYLEGVHMNVVSEMAHDHLVLHTQRKTVHLHICKTILEFKLRGSRVSFTYSVGWLHTADTLDIQAAKTPLHQGHVKSCGETFHGAT